MAKWKVYSPVTLAVMVVLLTACKSTSMNQSQKSTPQYSSPLAMTEALMSDPQYLKECRVGYPTRITKQQVYRNIIPGQTTSATVKSLLGTPNGRTPSTSSEWGYDNFIINFTDGLVNSIFVRYDPQLTSHLEQILKRYGCPNFIFALNTSFESPSGNYNLTRFVYFDIGLDIDFLSFPTSLSDTSGIFTFYQAQPFKAYLIQWDFAGYDFDQGKPVTWSEAIKQ